MKILKLTFLAAIIAFTISCEKEATETAEIFFSGITHRDGNANLNGSLDPHDWQLNTTFTSREEALFTSDNLPICTNATDTVFKVYSYPNPSFGLFVFGTIIPMDSIALRIVDDNFNILYQKDNLTASSLAINENKDGDARVVRLYYRVYNGACKYQGYGDIAIE